MFRVSFRAMAIAGVWRRRERQSSPGKDGAQRTANAVPRYGERDRAGLDKALNATRTLSVSLIC